VYPDKVKEYYGTGEKVGRSWFGPVCVNGLSLVP